MLHRGVDAAHIADGGVAGAAASPTSPLAAGDPLAAGVVRIIDFGLSVRSPRSPGALLRADGRVGKQRYQAPGAGCACIEGKGGWVA